MVTPPMPEPSKRLVLQRVRNRIIEYLELASSFDAQRQYEFQVPIAVVPEIVDSWEDSVVEGWEATFVAPVFSKDERVAVARFDKTLSDITASLPDQTPDLSEVQRSVSWSRLRDVAADALAVLVKRGKLSEDIEVAD